MKKVIGSEEWVAFPEIGLPAIKARVDSGAKTSALHAFNIQSFRRAGELWVSFSVHPIQNNRRIVVSCQAKVIDQRKIKNTSGVSEKRFVIAQTMQLGEETWKIQVTLTNRDSMGYRMLLGREAMDGKLMIDPSSSFLHGELFPEKLSELYPDNERKTKGLNIGLLASNPELYSNRRIIEAAEERGHNIEFLNIRNCYIKLDAHQPEVHYRGKNALEGVDAIIPRIRPSLTYYGCSVVRQFESMGVFCLNHSEAIRMSRDKLLSSQLLLSGGIATPITGFANSPLDTDDLIDMVGGPPLIVKLLEGTQGMGVVLTETKKAAESVISAFKSLKANILVQEFIEEAGGTDIRLFVVDNKVVAAIKRTASPGEFRANLHQGGTATLVKVPAEEKKMAIQAAKNLGLKVAGVDIIRSERGPLVLEVNSSPGLEGVEEASGKDIAGLMIEAIERRMQRSSTQ